MCSKLQQGTTGGAWLQVRAQWTWEQVLTGQSEYSQSCKCLGSCLVTECLKMRSNTLFHVYECGFHIYLASPDIIYVVSVPSPFPFFTAPPLSCIILFLYFCVKLQCLHSRIGDPRNEATEKSTSNPCSWTTTSLVPRPLATFVPGPPPVSFPGH